MIANLIIGFGLQLVGFLLQTNAASKADKRAKPKKSDFKEPKAEPGRPMVIIAGTVLIEDPQILLTAEKSMPRRWVRMKPK